MKIKDKLSKVFSKGIKYIDMLKELKKQKEVIKSLEEMNDQLHIKNDNLEFQITRDDKLQQIEGLKRRQEDYLKERRELRNEIKELKSKRKEN